MARRPSSPDAIPRLRKRKRGSKVYYYYDHGARPRHETALGSDYGLAIKRWAELEGDRAAAPAREVITFRYVADRYRSAVIPTKAPRTQRDNIRELAKLLEFFDDPPCPLDAIEPQHVRQYLTWRGRIVRANRERALLSHVWNWAREQGYTALANPCAGVRGAPEQGRDVYVHDDQYRRVWDAAEPPLRDAMDLAYLTGQRPADVLRMDERDIRDGAIEIAQGKTRAKLRIEVTGELAAVLGRISARKRGYVVRATSLIVDGRGQPLTRSRFRRMFDEARAEAGETWQFRDLRAKAATDKTDAAGDIRQAQVQMGHSTIVMTEHYVRKRRGAKVTPTR